MTVIDHRLNTTGLDSHSEPDELMVLNGGDIGVLHQHPMVEPRFKLFSKAKGLRVRVDTNRWPRDDQAHPDETNSISSYENLISEISELERAPFIFIGGEKVAKNKELLQAKGITHILNCSGAESPNHFPSDFIYKTIRIVDSPHEDISQFFVDAIKFIEKAASVGGKVLIHCCKGVSRSAALVIAYLISKNKWTFEKAYGHVKSCRPVSAPNAGFSFSLMEWEKHLLGNS